MTEVTERMTGLPDYVSKEIGEISHENAVSGYRLRDGNGFRLSSFRSPVLPEWHVAKRSIHLR